MLVASSAGQTSASTAHSDLGFIKNPVDPRWNKDAGMKLYRKIMKRYLPAAAQDGYHTYGMASAFTMADALRRAGRNLTGRCFCERRRASRTRRTPFLLPGITASTRPNDRFPIAQAQLQRYSKGRWIPFGGPVTARG